MDQERAQQLAEWWLTAYGIDGGRVLRDELIAAMARHRKALAGERNRLGLSRPRADRPSQGPTTAEQRRGYVSRWRPDLLREVDGGAMSLWSAYRAARDARDAKRRAAGRE